MASGLYAGVPEFSWYLVDRDCKPDLKLMVGIYIMKNYKYVSTEGIKAFTKVPWAPNIR